MARTPTTSGASRTPGTATLLVGVALLGALAAFLAGRWAADSADHAPGGRPGRAAARAVRPAVPAATSERPWASPAPEPGTLAAAAASAPAPAPVATPGRATPELVKRATAETSAILEAARAELDARCWPRDGLSSGHESTLVTFSVTYDANGREIARGLSEDRRARAPELLRCLQKLPLGSLRISPTGANVGVRVAMRLP